MNSYSKDRFKIRSMERRKTVMWKPEKKEIRVVWNDNHSANKPVVVLPASGTSDENRQLVREDMSMPILLFVLLIRCVMLMLENMALKTENQNLKNQKMMTMKMN